MFIWIGLSKKTTSAATLRHQTHRSLDKMPLHVRENIENIAPNNSPECFIGHIARAAKGDEREKIHVKKQIQTDLTTTEISQMIPINTVKSTRVLTDITNIVGGYQKSARNYRDFPKGRDPKSNTMSEGFDPENCFRAKKREDISSSPKVPIRNLSAKSRQSQDAKSSPQKGITKSREFGNTFIQDTPPLEKDYKRRNESYNEKHKTQSSMNNVSMQQILIQEEHRPKVLSEEGNNYHVTVVSHVRDSTSSLEPHVRNIPPQRIRQPPNTDRDREVSHREQQHSFNFASRTKIKQTSANDYMFNNTEIIGNHDTNNSFSMEIHQEKVVRKDREADSGYKQKYIEQQAINLTLEKEILDLKKEIHELKEGNKFNSKEKKEIEELSKSKEKLETRVLKVEHEKINLIQENDSLKCQLDDVRKSFQLKLLNFNDVICKLQEEIQMLHKKGSEIPKNHTERAAWGESFNDGAITSTKARSQEQHHSETYVYVDADSCWDHHQTSKDQDPYQKSVSKFIDCVINLIIECSPSNAFNGGKPTLKESWKWIKNIIRDYKVKRDSLDENEEILKTCLRALAVKEKRDIVPSLQQLLMQKNRLQDANSRRVPEYSMGSKLEEEVHKTGLLKQSLADGIGRKRFA